MLVNPAAAYALLRGHGRIRSPCRRVSGEQRQVVMLCVVFTTPMLAAVQVCAVFVERRALFVAPVGPCAAQAATERSPKGAGSI